MQDFVHQPYALELAVLGDADETLITNEQQPTASEAFPRSFR